MDRLLLCTDLDRTLLPNGDQPESPGARAAFTRLAGFPEVRTVYVTGRNPGLVDEAIASWDLPVPDLLIADVGTTVASPSPDRWERWPDWDRTLAGDWNGLARADLASAADGLAGFEPQGPDRQTDYKLSWFTPAGPEGQRAAGTVRRRLAEAGIPANVVWSEDETTGRGLLDILPPSATKRLALEFVIARWQYSLDEVVFAGDSGNDLDVLASAIPAVLVANADPSVRNEARGQADAAGFSDRLFCAGGGGLGMNGNYAAGILEGVLHYHPRWRELLEAAP